MEKARGRKAAKVRKQARALLDKLRGGNLAAGRRLRKLVQAYPNELGRELVAEINAALLSLGDRTDFARTTDAGTEPGLDLDDLVGDDNFAGDGDDALYDDGLYDDGLFDALPPDLRAIFDRMDDIESLMKKKGRGKGKGKGGKGKFKQILKNVKFIMGDVLKTGKGGMIATDQAAISKGRGSKALGVGSQGSFGRSRYVGEGAQAAFGRARYLGEGATGYFGHSQAGGGGFDDELYLDDLLFGGEEGLVYDEIPEDFYYYGDDGLYFDDPVDWIYQDPSQQGGNYYDEATGGFVLPEVPFLTDDDLWGDSFDEWGAPPLDFEDTAWVPGGTSSYPGNASSNWWPDDEYSWDSDDFFDDYESSDYLYDEAYGPTEWEDSFDWDYGSPVGGGWDENDAQEVLGLLEDQLGDIATVLQRRVMPEVVRLERAAYSTGDPALVRRSAAARHAVQQAVASHANGIEQLAGIQGDGLGFFPFVVPALGGLATSAAGALAGIVGTLAITGGAGLYSAGKSIGEGVGTGIKWSLSIAIPVAVAIMLAPKVLKQ